MIKFLATGNFVTSERDGTKHYISPLTLLKLYRLPFKLSSLYERPEGLNFDNYIELVPVDKSSHNPSYDLARENAVAAFNQINTMDTYFKLWANGHQHLGNIKYKEWGISDKRLI